MSCSAWASGLPLTDGTWTVGTLGPVLTNNLTTEFFETDVPALGSVDRTIPLAWFDAWFVTEPTVRWAACNCDVALACVWPTTFGTVTSPRERNRKKAMMPSATSRRTSNAMSQAVRRLRSSSGGGAVAGGTAMVRPV